MRGNDSPIRDHMVIWTSDAITQSLRIHFHDLQLNSGKLVITFINPIQTGGGLLRPYQTLKLNNFKTVKAMTTKFSDFS